MMLNSVPILNSVSDNHLETLGVHNSFQMIFTVIDIKGPDG